LISVAGMLSLGLFGQTVLELLVGHGNVTAGNVRELWWLMIWLAGMFIGGVVGQITSSTFYACGDTSTPTRISMVTYTAYIPAKVGAFYFFGVMGLAMATSFYYLVNLSLQIYFLEKRNA
jgi:putative peptidoglycan lipid II flippase